MTTQRLYQDMSAEEQLAWVTEYEGLSERLRGVIEAAARKRVVPTADAAGTVAGVRRLFWLLCAWPFAQEFCEKARRYGDYMARVSRLPVYMEKVNDALADGLTTTDAQGRRVAVVLPGVPARRRGRPTKEETAARLRGEISLPADDSPETRKRRAIARLLGLEIVSGEPVREKNNAELAQERAAKKAEEEKRNPSLFGPNRPSTDPIPAIAPTRSLSLNGGEYIVPDPENGQQEKPIPSMQGGVGGGTASPCAQLQTDAYELRMAQDKLHLNQLAWMLSPELAKRTETVQSLRVTSESASERAKLLAEQGQPAAAIEPYAQQAKEATEAYLAIYAEVDDELAVLHKRLYLDEPFVERFKARFKGVNIEQVQYITRPYYEKMKSPELDLRIKTLIEQDNPEYAAKMKAEEEKKREVSDLLRYLKRKDKPNVKQRIETMKKRYARLAELLGEQEASVYRPIVDAAIEDYEAHYKKPDADATGVVADGGKKKRGTKKAETAEK